MKFDRQDERRKMIEVAAYELLAKKGYKATSMLAIAKHASASNETMYRWYENKQALFRAMVEENAREVREALEQGIESRSDPLVTLRKIGPLLLGIVTSEKAIVLNRAAVGDITETGTLGQTIAEFGKGSIGPLIARIMAQARDSGLLKFSATDDPTTIYLNLLIGDLQIQRAIGVRAELTKAEIQRRSDRAYRLILRLFG